MKGISFYGSGGLLFYYVGVAQYIQENYDLKDIQYKCVSGGCLSAVLLSTGLNISELWENCIIPWITSINTDNGICNFLSENSMKLLLEKIHEFLHLRTINENDIMNTINTRLSIRVTKITLFGTEQMYINNWDSLKDLLECAVCSCWIPGVFGDLVKHYKGEIYIDGGFPKSIDDSEPDWLNIKIDSFQKLSHELKLFLYISSLSTMSNEKVATELYNLGYTDSKNNSDYFNSLKTKHN